ncbi:MAG: hypothetical protein K2M46_07850 [Lachnospiraceae bacterium]|nr:hypothetical protein [Lachnospiraceae bacterium]
MAQQRPQQSGRQQNRRPGEYGYSTRTGQYRDTSSQNTRARSSREEYRGQTRQRSNREAETYGRQRRYEDEVRYERRNDSTGRSRTLAERQRERNRQERKRREQAEEQRRRKLAAQKRKNAKKRRKSKVTRYRKPINFNIGMVIFGVIFIYVVSYVFAYMQKDHVVIYEVKQGSLAKNTTYTGLILRTENVVNASKSGYINFYAREGEKTGANSMMYTIDENGTLAATLAENGVSDVEPSSEELKSLRSEIMNFSSSFHASDFNEVYNFKYAFDSSVLKMVGLSMMNSVEALSLESGTAFERGSAPASGIVEYYTDGFEAVTKDTFTPEMLDKTNYQKTIIKNNDLISEGDAIYKMITDESWSIIIELTQDVAAQLEEKSSIYIIFKRDGVRIRAGLELFSKDGHNYAALSTKSSMIRYASDRYIDIELVMNDEEGLKIPVSSVVEKEFYLIPEEFAIVEEDSTQVQFLKEVTMEDGTKSTELVDANIYNLVDGEYYVSTDQFEAGQYINKKDSKDTYSIGKKASLIGVYNINKGYADFKEITKLYENNEYCIVKANSTYGLAVYDHIVLDASTVGDDQIIY